jgi:hypothetical protein
VTERKEEARTNLILAEKSHEVRDPLTQATQGIDLDTQSYTHECRKLFDLAAGSLNVTGEGYKPAQTAAQLPW